MCHFITLTLGPGGDERAVQELVAGGSIGFEPLDNPHVAAQLHSGERYYLATRGHCDCGTALGSARAIPRGEEPDVTPLRKKGWSVTKIRRWLEERERIAVRNERVLAGRERERAEELAQWIRFIRRAVERSGAPWLGLLLHLYSRAVTNERIDIRGRVRIPAATDPRTLLNVEEDVLYEFRR